MKQPVDIEYFQIAWPIQEAMRRLTKKALQSLTIAGVATVLVFVLGGTLDALGLITIRNAVCWFLFSIIVLAWVVLILFFYPWLRPKCPICEKRMKRVNVQNKYNYEDELFLVCYQCRLKASAFVGSAVG